MNIDQAKVKAEARANGRYTLNTNMGLPFPDVITQYKYLQPMEPIFRVAQSSLNPGPSSNSGDYGA